MSQAVAKGERTCMRKLADDLRKTYSLFPHTTEALWAFIDDESKCSAPHHTSWLKVSTHHDSPVILYGFGDMNHRHMHEELPSSHRCPASEDEVERFLIELRSRMSLCIEGKSPHTIDKVLEVRGDAEVPNGTCKDDAIRTLDEFLNMAEIISRSTCGIVKIE